MSDFVAEQEPNPSERIIKLNQEFTPWASEFVKTRHYPSYKDRPSIGFSSDIYI